MDAWRLTISGFHYLGLCAIGSFVVRIINGLFKAFSIQDAEAGEESATLYQGFGGFWLAFLKAISGFAGGPKIRDLCLPYFIGVAELAAYPILFFRNDLLVIGGWIVIKTAGSWSVWATSRGSFNRFLFGNVQVLVLSYLWLARYVVKV